MMRVINPMHSVNRRLQDVGFITSKPYMQERIVLATKLEHYPISTVASDEPNALRKPKVEGHLVRRKQTLHVEKH